jgi:hypothetical protein
MKKPIKLITGEIDFYDTTAQTFGSLEQLLMIVNEEYERKGLAESVRVRGVDEDGKTYRISLDFSVFQIRDGDTDSVSLEKVSKQKFLGELLVEMKVITPEQLANALQEQGKPGYREKFGEVLVRLGFCTPQQVIDALAQQVGVAPK